VPNPPPPERPVSPDGGFHGEQLTWALEVICWTQGHATRVLHMHPDNFVQMRKNKRLIPETMATWLEVLVAGHLRLWQPEGWPLPLSAGPPGAYRGRDMKKAFWRIGWRFDSQIDTVSWRLGLDDDAVEGMRYGGLVIPLPVAVWLEALAELHDRHPEPIGWRPHIPHEEWVAARAAKAAE
jgi:hypothetical protein